LATKEDSEGFQYLLNNFNQPQHILWTYHAKEFDIPFIARRMIINKLLPDKLNLFGKKPWEIPSGYVGVMEV
jgi:uncharacterized protein YprB with RNaseH-like and TPR domain